MGIKSDWITCAVKLEGKEGLTLLLIESKSNGIKMKQMKGQGLSLSFTTYITFEDVFVPINHLIGKEGMGFKPIMYNFNHERFLFIASSNRYSRDCIEESIKYSRIRKTFGKRLIDNQVIRHKIAEMISQVECVHSKLEEITYQMSNGVSNEDLGGPIALLKSHSTKVFSYCVNQSSQILGGNSYMKNGIGEKIERLYRELRFHSVAGGSEEILIDLAMKRSKL